MYARNTTPTHSSLCRFSFSCILHSPNSRSTQAVCLRMQSSGVLVFFARCCCCRRLLFETFPFTDRGPSLTACSDRSGLSLHLPFLSAVIRSSSATTFVLPTADRADTVVIHTHTVSFSKSVSSDERMMRGALPKPGPEVWAVWPSPVAWDNDCSRLESGVSGCRAVGAPVRIAICANTC